jgi:hypothetical protein
MRLLPLAIKSRIRNLALKVKIHKENPVCAPYTSTVTTKKSDYMLSLTAMGFRGGLLEMSISTLFE